MKGRNQLLMGFSGSFENITVVQSPDGDTIIRGKITQMTNPNTLLQQEVRSRFRDVTRRAVVLKNFIRTHFEPKRLGVTPYASFISKNMTRTNGLNVVDLNEEAALDFYTDGTLSNSQLILDQLATTIVDDNSITFVANWVFSENGNIQNINDKLLILSFDIKGSDWNLLDTGLIRRDEAVTIKVTTWPQGTTVVVPFFFNETETKSSTSIPLIRRVLNGTIEFL